MPIKHKDERTEAFAGWCIVELLGHRRLAGYVTEAAFPAGFVRIDIPGKATQVYNPKAVFSLTPTTEEMPQLKAPVRCHHGEIADECPRCDGDDICPDSSRDGRPAGRRGSMSAVKFDDLVDLQRQGRLFSRRDGREQDLKWLREIIKAAGLFDLESWALFCDRSRMTLQVAVRQAFRWGRAFERWAADDARDCEPDNELLSIAVDVTIAAWRQEEKQIPEWHPETAKEQLSKNCLRYHLSRLRGRKGWRDALRDLAAGDGRKKS